MGVREVAALSALVGTGSAPETGHLLNVTDPKPVAVSAGMLAEEVMHRVIVDILVYGGGNSWPTQAAPMIWVLCGMPSQAEEENVLRVYALLLRQVMVENVEL